MSRQTLFCVLAAVLTITCEIDQRPEYMIVLLNTGPAEINDAAVKYGNFTSLGGVLIPNAEKGQSGVRVPVPGVVTVVWTTTDGRAHQQVVAVRGKRPFRKLNVTINGQAATVTLTD